MAKKHRGEPEAIDSSPAGIARALCVKGNADAEIAIAQTRVVRGGVSIDFLKSLLPPPYPGATPHNNNCDPRRHGQAATGTGCRWCVPRRAKCHHRGHSALTAAATLALLPTWGSN